MSDTLSQVALREIRREFSKKTVLLFILGAGLVLGISGPFNTISQMGAPLRFAYWLIVAFSTYAIGLVVGVAVFFLMRGRGRLVQVLVAALGTGLAISLFLLPLSWIFLGRLPNTPFELIRFVAEVTFIAFIIVIGRDLAINSAAREDAVERPPEILDRLPFEKRGALVSLSATDHYVTIVTTQGQEMILMRLADAIREVGQTEGLHVHRSHWIAMDQIASVERAGDGATLTMTTGGTIPVSRANMPAIRDAGLLPKR